jgi:hypothetical protein
MGFSPFHLPPPLKQGEAYYKTFILNIKYQILYCMGQYWNHRRIFNPLFLFS